MVVILRSTVSRLLAQRSLDTRMMVSRSASPPFFSMGGNVAVAVGIVERPSESSL